MFGGDTRENFIGERPFGNLLHGAAQQPEPYAVVAGDAQVDRRLEEQRTAFGVLNRITPIREVGITAVEHDLSRDVDVFLHVAGPEGCRKGEVLFRGGRGIHAERLGDTYGRFGRAAELILIEERNHRDAPFRRVVLPGVECEFSVGEGQVFDPCPAFLVPVADREVDARIDGRFNGDFVVCCRGGNRQGFGFETDIRLDGHLRKDERVAGVARERRGRNDGRTLLGHRGILRVGDDHRGAFGALRQVECKPVRVAVEFPRRVRTQDERGGAALGADDDLGLVEMQRRPNSRRRALRRSTRPPYGR